MSFVVSQQFHNSSELIPIAYVSVTTRHNEYFFNLILPILQPVDNGHISKVETFPIPCGHF